MVLFYSEKISVNDLENFGAKFHLQQNSAKFLQSETLLTMNCEADAFQERFTSSKKSHFLVQSSKRINAPGTFEGKILWHCFYKFQ